MTGYSFRLYVAGLTARAHEAAANLRRLCESRLPGGFELEVIDVVQWPERADEDRILVAPTVIRLAPPPQRRVIGDLSDAHQVARALGLPGIEGQEMIGQHPRPT